MSTELSRVDGGATGRPGRAGRRLLDVVVGVGVLLVLGLPMLLVALLIRVTSPGPALFRQVRLGQDARPFVMLKFRTMRQGAGDAVHRAYVTRLMTADDGAGHEETAQDGLYKLGGDVRVTGLGAVLRRTSIDELPQLVNVLRGEMALVGPRPMLPWEYAMLRPEHRSRFRVPAGMTGLWQVSGRSRLTMTQALELDVRYAESAGAWLDLRILARTVLVVLMLGGAR